MVRSGTISLCKGSQDLPCPVHVYGHLNDLLKVHDQETRCASPTLRNGAPSRRFLSALELICCSFLLIRVSRRYLCPARAPQAPHPPHRTEERLVFELRTRCDPLTLTGSLGCRGDSQAVCRTSAGCANPTTHLLAHSTRSTVPVQLRGCV